MNARFILIVGSATVCLATVAGVLVRGRQLGDLRAEQQLLLSRQEAPVEISPLLPAVQNTPAKVEQRSTASPSLELLRLRSEANRLTNRRRELADVANENERLQIRIAISRTNANAPNSLPPGYIRKSAARMVGYSTPEGVIESMLWAVQNRDFTNFVQAFGPEDARQFEKGFAESGRDPEEFFKEIEVLPGMRILSRQQASDGSIQSQVEIAPGVPLQSIIFRQINGQWKMENH